MTRLVAGLWLIGLLLGAPSSGAEHCACDCDGDGRVAVAELVRVINIALVGDNDVSSCEAALDPRCLACTVQINTLIGCVDNALHGCPDTPTPTPTATATIPGGLCTPPPCAGSNVLVCNNCPEPCPGGCGFACASPTPKCTAPICAAGEVLHSRSCGDGCPICATPTPTVCDTPIPCPTSQFLVFPPNECAHCATITVPPSTPTPTQTASPTITDCPESFCLPDHVFLFPTIGCPFCASVTPTRTQTRTPT